VGPVIRRGFIPSPGCIFVTFDYSQIELRLLAHESQDPMLIDAFMRDLDIHSSVCHNVFKIPYDECAEHPKRTIAKNINFGIPYGIGFGKLASFTLTTVEESAEYISAYFNTYKGVKSYIDRTHLEAYKNGFVETMFGRKRRLPDARSLDRAVAAAAQRQAQNSPIQSAAGQLIKRATVKQDELLRTNGWPYELLLQVHDELIYEVNLAWLNQNMHTLQLMSDAMCNIVKLRVPIKVSCERLSRWGDKIVKEDDLIREQFEEVSAA
jgi:DNA polymerase-1